MGRLANANPPELRTYDRYGHRIDEVEFHPAWHELMRSRSATACTPRPWSADPKPDAHVARAAGFFVWCQVEPGHGCPISMTYAVVPALRRAPRLAARYEAAADSPPATTRAARRRPTKAGLLAGMGDDREAGRLRRPGQHDPGRPAGRRHATGSPATSGSARRRCATCSWCWPRPPGGLTCFLVPRVLPDGERNAFRAPAAEGQARQPVERVERGRVRRHRRLAGRRGGPRACRRSSRWSP